MTQTVRTRPRTASAAELPSGEINLQSPPLLPKGSGQAATQLMFMLPMMLGMGAMSFVYIGRSGGVMTYVFGALYASVMVGMVVMSLSRGGMAKRAQINDERRDYQRYLSGLRSRVREVAEDQRSQLLNQHPEPAELWSFVASTRLWERRRADADFGQLRIGLGPQRLATPLRAPQTVPLEDLDPVSSTALRHFIRTYSTVDDLPVALSLRSLSHVELSGDRAQVLATAPSPDLPGRHLSRALGPADRTVRGPGSGQGLAVAEMAAAPGPQHRGRRGRAAPAGRRRQPGAGHDAGRRAR